MKKSLLTLAAFVACISQVHADGVFTRTPTVAASSGGGGGGTTPPGGSTSQVQYNNAGAFAGASNLRISGSTVAAGASATIPAGTPGLFVLQTTDSINAGLQVYNTAQTQSLRVGVNGSTVQIGRGSTPYISFDATNNNLLMPTVGTGLTLTTSLTLTGLTSAAGTGALCTSSVTSLTTYSVSGCTVSSRNMKENIHSLTNGLDLIMGLQPVMFTYKTKFGMARGQQIGFIAEDVDPVLPYVVGHFKMPKDTPLADGSKLANDMDYANVDYAKITAPLVGAVQELKRENDALKARVEVLEQR